MDYQELLFAAEVHKVAVDLYRSQRGVFIENNAGSEAFEQTLANWEQRRPFEYWFQQAYESISLAAKTVRELRKKEAEAEAEAPDLQ